MFGTLMSNKEIIRCLKTGDIVIEPFNSKRLELAHYSLMPSRVFLESKAGSGELRSTTVDLKTVDSAIVPVGQSALVEIREALVLKAKIIGFFEMQSRMIDAGLGFFGGKLDPFYGREGEKVVFRVANLMQRPIPIVAKAPIAHVCFFDLRGVDAELEGQGPWPMRTEENILTLARRLAKLGGLPEDYFEGVLE